MTDFLVSDLHITAQERDSYRMDFLKRLPKLAREHGANCVWILGDVTEQKDKLPARLVNPIVDLMSALGRAIPTVILAGNHDGETPDEIYFQFLSNLEHITFITKPTVMGKTLLLPHTRDWERDWARVSFEGIKRIFTHNTFKSSINERGQEMDGIPVDALPAIPIYSGDVHVPHRNDTIIYIGAPYTIRFGDDFEPRAILLGKDGMRSIPLHGPQKRVLHTGTDGWWKGQANKGDIVRVQVEMRRKDYARWAELYEKCQNSCAKRGLIVDSIVPTLVEDDESDEPKAKAARRSTRSDEQEFKLYCDRNQVDDATRKLGEELL